jgi:hypothetical protein
MKRKKSKPRASRRNRRSANQSRKRRSSVQPYSRYKLDTLPPHAQAVVFRGFARFNSYATIRKALAELGFHISQDALSRYRRNAYKQARNRLKRGRAMMEVMKEQFLLDPNSTAGQITQEMLYTQACNKAFEEEEPKGVLSWVREGRELAKVGNRKSETSPSRPPLSEEEIDRRVRELYGLPPEDDSPDPDDNPKD